ncbi:MAG: helicase HerA domain-containing protein [Candidatus Flexifilum sp.]
MSQPTPPYDLERLFPRDPDAYRSDVLSSDGSARLGVVVGGSLSKGLVVKLDAGQSIEDLAVGRYVVVHGENKRFFCMITDVALDNTNPDIQNYPPEISDPFLRAVYIGTAAYGRIHVQPMLSLDLEESLERARPRPVKTIPAHFMAVKNATAAEVNAVFGQEDENHFYVGEPLELETTQINLDLKRLSERSVGIFGKSGTGKSFLTRLILAGLIARGKASALIFDMHNDYGSTVRTEGEAQQALGLKDLLHDRVSIVTLDPESSRRRGVRPDIELKISYDAIEPEDFEMLRETMGLSDAMIDAIYMLRKRWGTDWIQRLLEAGAEDFEAIEETTPTKIGTLLAVQRRVQRFERWEFLTQYASSDQVDAILGFLSDKGKSVVLEFGRYGSSLDAYILVANYLTRRIHEQYVDRVERALGDSNIMPHPLMIVIEEAHKFLDPRIASKTIFGVIARELRKYNVTLLIVDQRPSGIDEEVMSQIGTRITALLDNERDIAAVLTGISGAASLREVLARLDTRQQAIIMGHAVPMPVVVRTRNYDQTFYEAVRAMAEGRISGQPIAEPQSRIGRGPRRIG